MLNLSEFSIETINLLSKVTPESLNEWYKALDTEEANERQTNYAILQKEIPKLIEYFAQKGEPLSYCGLVESEIGSSYILRVDSPYLRQQKRSNGDVLGVVIGTMYELFSKEAIRAVYVVQVCPYDVDYSIKHFQFIPQPRPTSPVKFTVDWTDMATVHQYKGLGFHCISILSKRDPDFDLSGFQSTLELEFDDVRLVQENKALRNGVQKEWRLFSQEDAEKVWRYVEQLPYGASILVHCEAGVSRSSAVAAALATIYCNGNDTYIFQSPKALPNLYVYGMMMMHCPRKGVVAKGIIL
jgi:predicted protein tyrosine phosphatase